ncbi:hypothetical protein PR003_g18919 [Phytophthora rubi]|uniref:Uncharacterized protein n=1 Tax=Phytophthora rubi TaxID=129364 RepID=A0A6A3JSH1_9STRA|nr:hypothetical protein PR001_g19910 [Phytophthora rubi]KAE9005704.1 hypothetical protein PR002_g16691 [Phytophthora rubi]KAE9315714.1 hypothetical protein PR003_g18919 [Phytophthora rubi]
MEEGHLPSAPSSRPPAGVVCPLPDGGFYVQACHPDVNFCLVSPGLDAAAAECRNAASSSGVADAFDLGLDATAQVGDLALLDAVDAIDLDNVEEPAVGSGYHDNAPSSRLLNAVDAMDSDDEEQLNERSGQTTTFISGAAQDLCPTIDPLNLSDTDSSDTESSSSSFEEDDEFDDSDVDVEADGEESKDEQADKTTATTRGPHLSSWECDYVSVSQVDAIIRSNMAEVEAKKPWRFVFRCLEVPFNFKRRDDPFDVFFMRWDEFWRVHGHAVWERDFWQPLLPGSTEYHRRKWRQWRAQRAFRELATDLEERLGKQFRPWLGKAPHEGWWYRVEPFALRRLFLKNRSHYVEYLESRVKERWPRGKRFLVQRELKPMWWIPDPSPRPPAANDGV